MDRQLQASFKQSSLYKKSIFLVTCAHNDNQHKHFGKGQTETEVFLQPGKYKLTLQFADGVHRSYGEKLRKSIEITVK